MIRRLKQIKYYGFTYIQRFQFSWIKWISQFQGYVNSWLLSIPDLIIVSFKCTLNFMDQLNKKIDENFISKHIDETTEYHWFDFSLVYVQWIQNSHRHNSWIKIKKLEILFYSYWPNDTCICYMYMVKSICAIFAYALQLRSRYDRKQLPQSDGSNFWN